jgi:hypothetical protein
VGSNSGNITNCYAAGAVIGGENSYGLQGHDCHTGGVVGFIGRGDNSIINCVALNPRVMTTGTDTHIGRVAGGLDAEFTNNWAYSAMSNEGGTPFPSGNGSAHVNGADCEAVPLANWWTNAPPAGAGWSETIWTFTDGQLPKLK